jgi:zinc-ribbon domain
VRALKTVNGIVGSGLAIIGVLSLAGAVILISGICTKTAEASVLLHVPTCDQTTATFFVLLLVGIAFLVIGIIVLRKGKQRDVDLESETAPRSARPAQTTLDHPRPNLTKKRFCMNCGFKIPIDSKFCPSCGAESI